MDFTNRGQQNNNAPRRGAAFSPTATVDDAPASPAKPAHASGDGHHLGLPKNDSKWSKWGGGLLVIAVGLLIAAALALLMFARPSSEGDLVNTKGLQAVFLTNDQVYFGYITNINENYLTLDGIYYLQSGANNKTTTDSNISLIKLGCELHKPQDRMVINQSQINFWENLQDDGQVAKLVKQFQEANPNGQQCSDSNTNANPVQGNNTTESTTDATNATTPANTPNSNTNDTNTNNANN